MPEVERDGVTLFYETGGPAAGFPVALVEGLGYSRWMWRWQREALEDRYRTIVPDNRGTGDSDAPEGPYTIELLAADLEAVLADAGVDRVHLIGASMGGMIAQQYALDFDRARSLALFCTSHGGEEAVPVPAEVQDRMFNVPADLDEREAVKYKMAPAMTETFRGENPELVDRIVDWRLETDAPDPARAAQGAAVQAFDVADQLEELTLPTLVMHGTADRVLPVENARRLHDRLPNSVLELVDGGPHLFFIERPEAVNERLLTFLDEHAGD